MINCVQCDKPIVEESEHYYDSWREHLICSDDCLENWLDDNYDDVQAYYRRMNIE